MSSRRERSPAELAAAIEANDSEFLMALGRAGGGEVRDDSQLRYAIGGSPVDYHNCVAHAELTPEDVDAAIDEVVERLRSHRVPGTWHVGPTSRPEDLGARLKARGFKGGWSDVGMAAALRALREDAARPAPPNLQIERVRDRAGLDAWVQARALDPEGKEESRWVAGVYQKLGLGDDSAWRHYVAWLGGEPVGTSTLFLGAGVAGVYFVLTRPEVRRLGIGAALTLAALHDARQLGNDIGVLGASPMGVPLYERLGFREYCRIAVYEWAPENAE